MQMRWRLRAAQKDLGNGSTFAVKPLGVRKQTDEPRPLGKQSKSHILKRRGKRSHRPHLKWPHLARPITTPSAIKLFFELYGKHTSGSRTSWDEMAVDWNTRLGGSFEVLGELTKDSTLHFTTPAYLRKFEEGLVMREVGKISMGYFDTIDAIMRGTPASSRPSVSHNLNLAPPQNRSTNLPDRHPLGRPHPSQQREALKRQKIKNQGGAGVLKKCAACAKNGKDVLLSGHKKFCPYKK